jgi:tripartite-type tricarboxylate transporter receptor subunit TctC
MMNLPVRVLVVTIAALCCALPAHAQSYPDRPVKIVVPTVAGGTVDLVTRVMAADLSERLHGKFFIENRSGAGNTIGSKDVAEAAPDGYTLLMSSASGQVISPMIYKDPGYDSLNSFVPIAPYAEGSVILVVNPSLPFHSVADLVAYAKANPGKLNMASPGIGTGPHMAGELFKAMAGIDMTHVAYRSSAPILTDLLGGQVQVYFAPISVSIEYVRSGKVRALGVTTATRAVALPDVPPLGDGVPGYEMTTWYGIAAPKNTPAEIVDTLNKEINGGLADPGVTAHLTALGSSPFALSPAAFGTFIADETGKWAKVIRTANIKAD